MDRQRRGKKNNDTDGKGKTKLPKSEFNEHSLYKLDDNKRYENLWLYTYKLINIQCNIKHNSLNPEELDTISKCFYDDVVEKRVMAYWGHMNRSQFNQKKYKWIHFEASYKGCVQYRGKVLLPPMIAKNEVYEVRLLISSLELNKYEFLIEKMKHIKSPTVAESNKKKVDIKLKG